MTATFSNAMANSLMTALAASGGFVSLHSADPGITGASELANSGYTRKSAGWGAASGQQIANASGITFGPAGEEWDEATYVGLWSAESGGSFIAGAELDAPVTVPNAGSATFAIGELVFSLDAIS